MRNGLDMLAIPGDQKGMKEKMSRSVPYLARQLSVFRPGGSGSQLVNAACFLVPDVDANGTKQELGRCLTQQSAAHNISICADLNVLKINIRSK